MPNRSPSSSAAAELSWHGLPVDVAEATRIIEDAVGPRPADEADALARQEAADAEVLQPHRPGRRSTSGTPPT